MNRQTVSSRLKRDPVFIEVYLVRNHLNERLEGGSYRASQKR